MADVVTERVRELIGRGVTQLDQLEVVIAMATAPGRRWTAQALAEAAQLGRERVAAALGGLEPRGVVVRAGEGHALADALNLAGLRTLLAVHTGDRARVVNAFFACNLAALREGRGGARGGPAGVR